MTKEVGSIYYIAYKALDYSELYTLYVLLKKYCVCPLYPADERWATVGIKHI